jgi:hypothetical protein
MFKLNFKYNGRQVSAHELSRMLTKDLMKEATKVTVVSLRNKIRSMRCPIHGSAPRIRSETISSANGVSFKFSACCQVFIDSVRKELQ